MKYGKGRIDRLTEFVGQASPQHPMLRNAAGAVAIVAVCTTAKNALALTLAMLAICVVRAFVHIFEKDEYIQPMRTVVYFVPLSVTVFLYSEALFAVSPKIFGNVAAYLPLLAADGIALERLSPDAPYVPLSRSLQEGIAHWWLYALLAMPIGMIREMIGNGTIFDHRLHFYKISGTALPFVGFIMLGFGLAIAQWHSRRQNDLG